MADEITLISKDDAQNLSLDLLEQAGYSTEHAAAIAECVIKAQMDECHSHGLYRLLSCYDLLKRGKVDPKASPVVEDRAPAIVRVDAQRGISLTAFKVGLPILARKAKSCGLAALAINNCFHFSALWPEVEAIADEGLVAIAMTPSHAWVAPAGGRKPVFGTNPLAFGWPRAGRHPFVFDFATSGIARGDIELHRRAGKTVAQGRCH